MYGRLYKSSQMDLTALSAVAGIPGEQENTSATIMVKRKSVVYRI